MTNKTDFDKCYDYIIKAQQLIWKAQDIFDKYDIPFVASCPGDASCVLDDCIGALNEYVESIKGN